MPNFYYHFSFYWQNTARDEAKQLALIQEGNHEKIMAYLEYHFFFSEAELVLLERRNLEEIRQSLVQKHPSAETEKEFLRRCSPETVRFYLEHFQLCLEISPEFVRNEAPETVRKCLPEIQLFDEAQVAFVKKSSTPDVLFLLKNQNIIFSKTQLEIVHRGVAEEIREMLHYQKIDPQTFPALLRRGNHEEIMLYLKKHNLPEAGKICRRNGLHSEKSLSSIREFAEKALLKRGNSAEIIAYCRQLKLLPENETALLQRGNGTEIMFYLTRYRLTEDNEKLLQERNLTEELQMYNTVRLSDCETA